VHVEVFTVLRIEHRRTPLEATKEATKEIKMEALGGAQH
jgi:hypothetical protein